VLIEPEPSHRSSRRWPARVERCESDAGWGRLMIGSDIATIERYEACRHAAVSKAVLTLNAPLVTTAAKGQPGKRFAHASLASPEH